MSRRVEVALLVAVLAVGAALRLLRPGADVPVRAERTDAPVQDAFWYLEAATGPAEGLPRDLEPIPVYDPPVWVHTARLWFSCAGVSLGAAQALGALVSLATVLLVWRLARAALGRAEGLVAAAVLATLYPFVWLSRTTLVYGPAALALTAAVALAWAGGRRPHGGRAWVDAAAWSALALGGWTLLEVAGATPAARALGSVGLCALVGGWWIAQHRWPDATHRALTSAAAWTIVGVTTLALRPPALAAAGGLALLHIARARRPLRTCALVAAALSLAVAVVALLDPGNIRADTLDRLQRYLRPEALSPAGMALRVLRLGGEPHGASGSGYLALAPGACLAAALGALAAASRPARDGRRRDVIALFGGWAALFLAGAAVLDYRPLRYFAVLGPPVAVFAALALGSLLRASGPAEGARWRRSLALAAFGALVAPHALELAGGPQRLDDLLPASVAGAAAGLGAEVIARRLGPGRRRACAWLVAAVAVAPGALGVTLDLARPGWLTLEANQAARSVLAPDASLVGPHASVLALGNGIERRRAPWIDVSPGRLGETVARLRRLGATHVALGIEQATSSGFVDALTAHGTRPELVGIFTPRGTPVLLLRLPWAEEVGYRLSAFEVRRRADEAGDAPPTEADARLLLVRVRALAFQGAPDQAASVLVGTAAQMPMKESLMAAARRAILTRGLR